MAKISVCMATYNGEQYINEQIDSILAQLDTTDELIISDDHSTDKTREIVNAYEDGRIKFIVNNGKPGFVCNFENALIQSSGDIIFLSDQDDVWLPNKIKEMIDFLKEGQYDVASCNCAQTDERLSIIKEEYYTGKNPINTGVLGNLVHPMWLGSCMAFTRKVLDEVLPFPKGIAAHDLWIGLWAQLHFRCGYYPKVLQYYRRHGGTASFAGKKSKNTLKRKLGYRFSMGRCLLKRTIERKL